MKVFIAGDHAGFELKQKLVPFLRGLGYEVEDKGAFAYDKDDDYPDFVVPVAEAVSATAWNYAEQTQNDAEREQVRGIILGGSGQGEAIVANRFPNVRAAEYYGGNLDIVRLSREHNDANILSLGARFLNEEEVEEAVKLWLETPFSDDPRHIRRLQKIDGIGTRH